MEHAKVLLVDDDDLARWAARERLLIDQQYEIQEANSAEAMLSLLETAAFDLVLLDIGLPGMSGRDALPQARQRCPKARIIMVTAVDEEESALACLASGAFDYLTKPLSMDELASIVTRALASDHEEQTGAESKDAFQQRFLGCSDQVQQLHADVSRIVRSRASTILIQGESGTGKGVLARAIHDDGPDRARPYMVLNCAALPPQLIESELFGHEKGAFTDAHCDKKGLFEVADGGTLVLDEIGELDISLQAKLLRGIEERCIKRVGGVEDIPVHARVIAITNADLEAAVEAGTFRGDLYYRLNVIPLTIPPLRQRPEDIPVLVDHFVMQFNQELGTEVKTISRGAMALLRAHSWPGNVRELRNVLERIMVLEPENTILADHLPASFHAPRPKSTAQDAELAVPQLPREGLKLVDVERDIMHQALQRCDGNITQAALLVGLQRDTFRYRARKLGIVPSE